MAHGDGALHRSCRQASAAHREVHVDLGEYFRVDLGTFTGELYAAALHIVATALEDQDHVIGGASTGTGQHGFHGARCEVLATVLGLGRVGRAVHHDGVAATGLRHKTHAGAGAQSARPADCAFHTQSPCLFQKGALSGKDRRCFIGCYIWHQLTPSFESSPMDMVLSHLAVSVTELKRNYAGILKQAEEGPIAVLNHNRPEAYLLPASHYEQLMEHLEDLEDAQLARERSAGPFVDVTLNDL